MKRNRSITATALTALLFASSLPLNASTLLADYNLGGSQSDVVWENLGNSNSALTPTTGSGSIAASNGGYQASTGFYKWMWSGPYTVTTGTTTAFDTNTVVLQLQWGLNTDYILQGAVLNYNGGNQGLAATWSGQTSEVQEVWVESMGQLVSYSVYTWQWDLSGIGDVVNSISVLAYPTIHSSTVAASLETGSGVNNSPMFSAVPEPSTYALMGLGLGALFLLRRRKARA